jgi:hypothetical protein
MVRPVARALGALTAFVALPLGCGDGTSGWVLTRNQSSPSLSGGSSSSTGGAGGDPTPNAGSGTEGGEGGAAGGPSPEGGAGGQPSIGPRDPNDFAEVCSPIVAVDNRTQTGNGQLFDLAMPDAEPFMIEAARLSCALLYKLPSEVPVTNDLEVVIEDFDGVGELALNGASTTLRLSSLHMRNVADAGGDVSAEIRGVSQYLIALDYVHESEDPAAVSWLHQGLGDWVRYEAGYTSIGERGPGGSWTDGFKTAGFFVDWLDETYPDAAYRLNQSMDPLDGVAWSEEIFVAIFGSDVATLWDDYQATL